MKDGEESQKEKKQSTHYMSVPSDSQSSDEEVFSMHNLQESTLGKVDLITTQT